MRRLLLLCVVLALIPLAAWAQRENLEADHPVYRFLLRQQTAGRIDGFSWGMLPLSRADVSGFLHALDRDSVRALLSATDRALLDEFALEFALESEHALTHHASLLPDFDLSALLRETQRRSLYAYADSTTVIVVDALGAVTRKESWGDSLHRSGATLGELGVRVRGTLHDRLGFFLKATNGSLLNGSHALALQDHRLQANRKFNSDEGTFYDISSGYVRYDAGWVSVMAGRDQILWGAGVYDRAMFSDNTVPFDFFRLDLRSGGVHYAFLHGSLVGGDSLGHTLSSKYIAAHRLEFSAGRRVRIGLGEAVLYANQPVHFAFLNPLSFMTSAELSTELPSAMDNAHNTLLWIDLEVRPVDDLRLFGSLLVDDLKFSTLGKGDISGNSNKFAWHAGMYWTSPGRIPGLAVGLEYARVNPFVLTHWTNINGYTNWGLSLGPSIAPNSDQWTLGADWDLTARWFARGRISWQRSGESIRDAAGALVFDAGDDILRGEHHLVHPNIFLEGRRVNRTLASASLVWQPILQYFVQIDGWFRAERVPSTGASTHDGVVSLQVRVEY